MEYTLSTEQEILRDSVRSFAENEIKPVARELDKQETFSNETMQKMAELGLFGIFVSEAYGGQEMDYISYIIATEEIARVDGSHAATVAAGNSLGIGPLYYFGSEEQKKKYLPKLCSGQALWGFGLTEANAGSDAANSSTKAVLDGDEWVINGTKTFITNGGLCGFYSVLCQTDPEAKPSYRGLSLILVEGDCPGVTATDVGPKMGIHMMATAEVNFKDVRVPATNLIGKEGQGFYQVLEFFDESRILVAAQALGTAQGAFDRALDYVKQREQFGKKIAQFQVTQHKLADMATKIELARLITYKAAWNYDQGRIDPKLTSMAKMFAARTAVEVADEAIQLLGGYGYMTEYEVERFYRDAKIMELYEGNRQIQKNTIASAILGNLR